MRCCNHFTILVYASFLCQGLVNCYTRIFPDFYSFNKINNINTVTNNNNVKTDADSRQLFSAG